MAVGEGGGGGREGAGGAGGEGRAGGSSAVLQYQRCELCREKLVFRARYRADAPKLLGFSEVRGVRVHVKPPSNIVSTPRVRLGATS